MVAESADQELPGSGVPGLVDEAAPVDETPPGTGASQPAGETPEPVVAGDEAPALPDPAEERRAWRAEMERNAADRIGRYLAALRRGDEDSARDVQRQMSAYEWRIAKEPAAVIRETRAVQQAQAESGQEDTDRRLHDELLSLSDSDPYAFRDALRADPDRAQFWGEMQAFKARLGLGQDATWDQTRVAYERTQMAQQRVQAAQQGQVPDIWDVYDELLGTDNPDAALLTDAQRQTLHPANFAAQPLARQIRAIHRAYADALAEAKARRLAAPVAAEAARQNRETDAIRRMAAEAPPIVGGRPAGHQSEDQIIAAYVEDPSLANRAAYLRLTGRSA